MSESPGTSSPNTFPVAYDEHLYDSFAEAASFQAFQYLNGNPVHRDWQKSQFLNGEIQNPDLDYPDLDLDRLEQTEANLLFQKQGLLANEQNEVVRQAYRWRLNEKLAEVRLLKAAATGDMHRFQRYSEFIYGKPSSDIFAYTVNSIRTKAQEATTSGSEVTKECAEELLKLLPKLPNPKIAELPAAETIEIAHKQTLSELGDLISLPHEDDKLDAAEIKIAFSTALERLGATNWQVSIDE